MSRSKCIVVFNQKKNDFFFVQQTEVKIERSKKNEEEKKHERKQLRYLTNLHTKISILRHFRSDWHSLSSQYHLHTIKF